MPKIWTCEYRDVHNETDNKIEIHSLSGGTDLGDFCLLGGYAVLSRNGQRDLFHELLSTSFEFTVEVHRGTDTFIGWVEGTLVTADPQNHYVKYYRKGNVRYIGIILNENINIPDAHPTFGITIQCTDAIGLLSRYKYNQNAAVVYISHPLLEHVYFALKSTGIDQYYEASDRFMATAVQFFETNYNSVTDDPLHKTQVTGRTFADEQEAKILETGDRDEDFWSLIIRGQNSDKVVQRICRIFAARIYQTDGYYKIAQPQESETAGMNQIVYNKNYSLFTPTPIVTETYSHAVSVNDDPVSPTDHKRLPGGQGWTFFPRVRHVLFKQKVGSSINLALGIKFKNVSLPAGGAADVIEDLHADIAFVDNTGEAILRITFLVESSAFRIGMPAPIPIHNILLHLTVVVGTYYLKRERTLLNDALEWTYTDMVWTTTPSVCEVLLTKQQQSFVFNNTINLKTKTEIEIETPKLEESGELDVKLEYIKPIRTTIEDRTISKLYFGDRTYVDITSVTLPSTSLGKEIIDKLIKVYTPDAYEYKDTPVFGQRHFGIDNALNRITFPHTIQGQGSPLLIKIIVKAHGPDLPASFLVTTNYRFNYETLLFGISVKSEDPARNVSDDEYIAHLAENKDTYREVIEHEVFLGDLPESDSIHRLQYVSGAYYIDTDLWQNRGTGPSLPLLQIAAESIAYLRSKLLRIFNMRLHHSANVDMIRPDSRITHDTFTYIMLRGQMDTYRNIFKGDFVEINRFTSDTKSKNSGIVSIDPPVIAKIVKITPYLGDADKVGISAEGLITHISTQIEVGVSDTISIDAVGDVTLYAGDTITLVNPVSGDQIDLTLTADLEEGDTTISVTEYFTEVYPAGTLVIIPPDTESNNPREIIIQSITGTTIDLTGYVLPDESKYTDDELNERISLEKNGTRQRYASTFTKFWHYKSSRTNEDITLQFAAVATDWFVIKFG